MSSDIVDLFFDILTQSEVEHAHNLELSGYPFDEAGTLSGFKSRQSSAPDLFFGAYLPTPSGPRSLIAFVCSTLSPALSLTHESMSTHVPSTSSVCIHSVCVAPDHRHKGIGLRLLREYITRLESATNQDGSKAYKRALLITHDDLRSFYEQAGFEWIGKSNVVHGSRPWFEMRKILGSGSDSGSQTTQAPQSDEPSFPPGLWDALQRSSRNRPASRSLATFNSILDVCTPNSDSTSNKFDLLCPREECSSVILKAGVATWVERASVQMEPQGAPSHSLLPALPPPPETAQWWLVTPSPMAFENIGFTRPMQLSQSPGKKFKLLTCAECDLGPFGWCEEGGTEFWLACSRVGYRE